MPSGKVVVAMSGGVDSSVAACLLHEQGYEVVGFFMRTGVGQDAPDDPSDRRRGCCSASDASDARFVAGKLGARFYALNFREEFESLIEYFSKEYANARTPNPCVVCNDRLKFGKLIDYAESIGAPYVATGHYARIGRRQGCRILQKAADASKDQSYVLFGLPRRVLRRVMFPIGGMSKQEVRRQAGRFDLPVSDKPESVDICFVPGRDYAGVVKARHPEAFEPGAILDADGKQVGEHRGLGHYTIGQRRGLRIALGHPVYVTGLDAGSNTVTVGSRQELLCRGLLAERVNWLIDPPQGPMRVTARIRSQHQDAPATAKALPSGELRVVFDEPQAAITAGQAVVLYDGLDCLGGGWIRSSFDP